MAEEKCYVCLHVFAGERPVLYACRDEGDWIFACGGDDHGQSADDWKVVHIGHLLEGDASLQGIAGLDDGQQAKRANFGEVWLREPLAE